jgi:adenylyltransferase/sulfurtransferase
MTKVMIPTSLRPHVDGNRVVEVDGDSVGAVLESLADQYPDLKSHLYDDKGGLASFINVFVNDENIRDRDGERTTLADRDEILLVPAMAGG